MTTNSRTLVKNANKMLSIISIWSKINIKIAYFSCDETLKIVAGREIDVLMRLF